MAAGYSGTPLFKKLGIKEDMVLYVQSAPTEYSALLGELPQRAKIVEKAPTPLSAAHLFFYDKSSLLKSLSELRITLTQTGFVWVSWPKKSSKLPTDITEDVIREIALPMGFVDIKVCAIDEVWSGLKLVIRRSERSLNMSNRAC